MAKNFLQPARHKFVIHPRKFQTDYPPCFPARHALAFNFEERSLSPLNSADKWKAAPFERLEKRTSRFHPPFFSLPSSILRDLVARVKIQNIADTGTMVEFSMFPISPFSRGIFGRISKKRGATYVEFASVNRS